MLFLVFYTLRSENFSTKVNVKRELTFRFNFKHGNLVFVRSHRQQTY